MSARYAVIEAQGLQFRVSPDEEHILPHLGAEDGKELTFDRVLLIGGDGGITLGRPLVEGASVKAKVVGTERGPKMTIGVYKRRKKYRRKIGYRDTLTRVRILDIVV
jgi:large subunit ribosomal protein L21